MNTVQVIGRPSTSQNTEDQFSKSKVLDFTRPIFTFLNLSLDL